MATIVKGTQAAKVPMEVPATSLVKGMMATMRIIKGTERMMLTIVPKTRLIGAFSRICPLSVVTKRMPKGIPMPVAMIPETATMNIVSSTPCNKSLTISGDIAEDLTFYG